MAIVISLCSFVVLVFRNKAFAIIPAVTCLFAGMAILGLAYENSCLILTHGTFLIVSCIIHLVFTLYVGWIAGTVAVHGTERIREYARSPFFGDKEASILYTLFALMLIDLALMVFATVVTLRASRYAKTLRGFFPNGVNGFRLRNIYSIIPVSDYQEPHLVAFSMPLVGQPGGMQQQVTLPAPGMPPQHQSAQPTLGMHGQQPGVPQPGGMYGQNVPGVPQHGGMYGQQPGVPQPGGMYWQQPGISQPGVMYGRQSGVPQMCDMYGPQPGAVPAGGMYAQTQPPQPMDDACEDKPPV